MKDYIIIGAGPAGSILGSILGEDHAVLIVEQRRMSGSISGAHTEKCCGGMLNPDAQKALMSLGISVGEDVLTGPQVFAVRAIDFDNHKERYYQKNYLNIDRIRFDRDLLGRAAGRSGVQVLEETRLVSYEEKEDHVEVTLRMQDGSLYKESGRYLIGADGAASFVRRHLDRAVYPASVPAKEYACLEQWFPLTEEMPYYTAIFDRYVTDYYSWMIPKKDQVILGTAIPKGPDLRLKFAKLKADLNEYGFDLKRPIRESGALLLRPNGFGSIVSGGERVFLVGEAAGLISPSSSEGISYAIRSAVALGAVLKKKGPHLIDRYDRVLKPLKREILFKSLKSPVMYTPWIRGLVFDTGLLSMEVHNGR